MFREGTIRLAGTADRATSHASGDNRELGIRLKGKMGKSLEAREPDGHELPSYFVSDAGNDRTLVSMAWHRFDDPTQEGKFLVAHGPVCQENGRHVFLKNCFSGAVLSIMVRGNR